MSTVHAEERNHVRVSNRIMESNSPGPQGNNYIMKKSVLGGRPLSNRSKVYYPIYPATASIV